MNVPEFGIGGVPVNEAAKIFGKSALWVRKGVFKDFLRINFGCFWWNIQTGKA